MSFPSFSSIALWFREKYEHWSMLDLQRKKAEHENERLRQENLKGELELMSAYIASAREAIGFLRESGASEQKIRSVSDGLMLRFAELGRAQRLHHQDDSQVIGFEVRSGEAVDK